MRIDRLFSNMRMFFYLVFIVLVSSGCRKKDAAESPLESKPKGPFHVYEHGDIQAALDMAAKADQEKKVIVHEGTYRPGVPGFSFLTLTAKHNGIVLVAQGKVTLSARSNSEDPGKSSSAIVNHVIYCGEGLTDETVIDGFTISGADGFVSKENVPIEPRISGPAPTRGMFFFLDGGALKVFGNSHPVIQNVQFLKNTTKLCGGAVSIEQQGFCDQPVRIENCLFKKNRCPGTGAAIDVLEGSAVEIENSLFVENVANYGMDEIARSFGLVYNPKHGCGALTVFPGSSATVVRSTFTENWNGVDDHGQGSRYESCIFWMNTRSDGSREGAPYELDIVDAAGVRNCFINGEIGDLRNNINTESNEFRAPDPEFDAEYRPQNSKYQDVGYRPVSPEQTIKE